MGFNNYIPDEIWKELPTNLEPFKMLYPDMYLISNYGRVRGARTSKVSSDGFLAPNLSDKNYVCISLSGPNEVKKVSIKLLVMLTFGVVRDDYMNHSIINLDGNTMNNYIGNLCWDDFYAYNGKKLLTLPACYTMPKNNNEIWVPLLDIYDLTEAKTYGYYISNKGRIFNKHKIRIVNGSVDSRSGYVRITLPRKDGKAKPYSVHRLVAEFFMPNPEFYRLQVNHINGIKTDNRLENLEWCTVAGNISHAYVTGLSKSVGQTHYNSKYSHEDICNILDMIIIDHIDDNSEIISKMHTNYNKYVSNDVISDLRRCRTRITDIMEYLRSNGYSPTRCFTNDEINLIRELSIDGMPKKDIAAKFNARYGSFVYYVIGCMNYIICNNAPWQEYIYS